MGERTFTVGRGGCLWLLLATWEGDGLGRAVVAASQDHRAIEAAFRLLRGSR